MRILYIVPSLIISFTRDKIDQMNAIQNSCCLLFITFNRRIQLRFVIMQELFRTKGLCLDPLKEFNSFYENILALINRDHALFAPGLLFIWNLSECVTEAILRDKFLAYGKILAIKLVQDVTRSSRQCALVNFINSSDGI